MFPSLLISSIVEIISPFNATLSSANANGPNGVPSSRVISVWKSSFASTLTVTESYVTRDGSFTDCVAHVTTSVVPADGSPFGNLGTLIFIGNVV